MKYIPIKGLELKIDPAIHEICETYNSTSGSSRSVLYTSVIVNVLVFITLINTIPWSWPRYRMDRLKEEIIEQKQLLANSKGAKRDSIEFVLRYNEQVLNNIRRNDIEHNDTVRVPLLGNTFDINSLGIVAGLTFSILLFIMRFTLNHEINNLRIALNAITDRYSEDSDEGSFTIDKTVDAKIALSSINYTRRQHHYNFLTMNEVFNLPPRETSSNVLINKLVGRVTMKMFYLPVIVYLLVFINDVATFRTGFRNSPELTICSVCVSFTCLLVLFYQASKCTWLKDYIFALYTAFKTNDYKWHPEMVDPGLLVRDFGHKGTKVKQVRLQEQTVAAPGAVIS